MFCGKCGASLGIDFRDFYQPKWSGYGISVSLLPGRRGREEFKARRKKGCVCVRERERESNCRAGLANCFGFNSKVRTFNGIDLDTLEFTKNNGLQEILPAGDLSGMWHDEGAETVTKTA